MTKVLRKVIKIDEELCNGCGQCVPSCAEGAIKLIDGKAKLVSETYCDGLGACLGKCPMGALSFEEREADEFDERAVHAHLAVTSPVEEPCHAGGCPGSRMFDFRDVTTEPSMPQAEKPRSELRQWPVKLNLLNPAAPYLQGAELVLAADCAAFAYGSFHPDFLKGKALAIGCPKFDDVMGYMQKLRSIIETGHIAGITIVHMEVPCCSGLLYAVAQAVKESGADVPVKSVQISIRGEIQP